MTRGSDVVVVVPAYRPEVSVLEAFSLRASRERLDPQRRVVLVGPQGMETAAYRDALGAVEWIPFPAHMFASLSDYSRLLLSSAFYDTFEDHGHVLILQPDAIVLKDDLDAWAQAPFDYIGAPWPKGIDRVLEHDQFAHGARQSLRAYVGNGGFSLRRVDACRALLAEFPESADAYREVGANEDLFFATFGLASETFRLPNPVVAARFARELDPRGYHAVHRDWPTGGHAWWRYDPDYWIEAMAPHYRDLARELVAESVRAESATGGNGSAARPTGIDASDSVHPAGLSRPAGETSAVTRTLDLGCGMKPKNPYGATEAFGIDVRDDAEARVVRADLVVEPIPFPDAMFDFVTAHDFIEHVPRLVYAPARRNAFVELMNEVHRVLKPGGLFLSMTPAWPHGPTFRDPTHVNYITEETFPLYFDHVNRWAAAYGFRGAFEVVSQQWMGVHLMTQLRKC